MRTALLRIRFPGTHPLVHTHPSVLTHKWVSHTPFLWWYLAVFTDIRSITFSYKVTTTLMKPLELALTKVPPDGELQRICLTNPNFACKRNLLSPQNSLRRFNLKMPTVESLRHHWWHPNLRRGTAKRQRACGTGEIRSWKRDGNNRGWATMRMYSKQRPMAKWESISTADTKTWSRRHMRSGQAFVTVCHYSRGCKVSLSTTHPEGAERPFYTEVPIKWVLTAP